ncbi:MAG: hypothetical protein H7124_18200 [Phycisphaerales bacterium]|nr:hypothetical protein [Hyphomonadaceae bacterium]
MKALDIVKAAGVALALMVLNVAAAFAVVWVYGTFIEPGQEEAFYQAAAQRIAPWSSIFVGMPLFFGAGWVLTKRKPARNGVAFAAAFALIYAITDVSIIVAAGALASLSAIVVASMTTKLLAALAGARLAAPHRTFLPHTEQER